jgi:hypothetical protein
VDRDRLHAVVGARDLAWCTPLADCHSGVGVDPEIVGQQDGLLEALGVGETPKRSLEALDDVSCPANLAGDSPRAIAWKDGASTFCGSAPRRTTSRSAPARAVQS